MKTSKTVAKLLFVVGALVYLVGLWISCPLLSGKGYFLGVLMTATLATMHIFAQKNSGNWMIFLPISAS